MRYHDNRREAVRPGTEISTMELQALAEETPTSYYTSKYSGEEIDALLDKVAAMTQEVGV